MKTTWMMLSLLAVCLPKVQTVTEYKYGLLDTLVEHEIITLVTMHSGLTEASCVAKCDAAFNLVDTHNEDHTDTRCRHGCKDILSVPHSHPDHHHHHQSTTPSA